MDTQWQTGEPPLIEGNVYLLEFSIGDRFSVARVVKDEELGLKLEDQNSTGYISDKPMRYLPVPDGESKIVAIDRWLNLLNQEKEFSGFIPQAKEWVLEGWNIGSLDPTPEQIAAALLMEANTQDECVKTGESHPDVPKTLRNLAFIILQVLHLDETCALDVGKWRRKLEALQKEEQIVPPEVVFNFNDIKILKYVGPTARKLSIENDFPTPLDTVYQVADTDLVFADREQAIIEYLVVVAGLSSDKLAEAAQGLQKS
jgi:hypothetical protein